MTLAKVKEQNGMTLTKVKKQYGMTLAKVKEQRWDDSCKSERVGSTIESEQLLRQSLSRKQHINRQSTSADYFDTKARDYALPMTGKAKRKTS